MTLAGRTALVTGSLSGLGHAIARALATAGANVMLHGLAAETGVAAGFDGADLRAPAEIARMAAAATGRFGGVDILVNNAVVRHFGAIEEISAAEWDEEIAVNLSAAFHLVRLTLPEMKRRGWGRILNVASVFGARGAAGRVGYVTTKTALTGLTRAIAIETARTGVTCNALSPGTVPSPAILDRIAATAADYVAVRHPTGRFVAMESVGALAAFLCDPAGADITGAARGIGRAIAAALAAEGARVIVSDRDGDAAAAHGRAGEIRAEALDITDAARIEALARDLAADGWTPDVLVNNAATITVGDLLHTTPEALRAVLAVNVEGTFAVTRAFLPAMIAGGGGTILNLASLAGIHGMRERFAYGATKAAIVQMFTSACVGNAMELWRVAGNVQDWGLSPITGWAILINADRWQKLPPDVREQIAAEMKRIEAEAFDRHTAYVETALQEMRTRGAKMWSASPDQRAALADPQRNRPAYDSWYARAREVRFDGEAYVAKVRAVLGR